MLENLNVIDDLIQITLNFIVLKRITCKLIFIHYNSNLYTQLTILFTESWCISSLSVGWTWNKQKGCQYPRPHHPGARRRPHPLHLVELPRAQVAELLQQEELYSHKFTRVKGWKRPRILLLIKVDQLFQEKVWSLLISFFFVLNQVNDIFVSIMCIMYPVLNNLFPTPLHSCVLTIVKSVYLWLEVCV